MNRLAIRFSKDMQRESNLQETANTTAEVVAGAENSYEYLIAACTRCVCQNVLVPGSHAQRPHCQSGPSWCLAHFKLLLVQQLLYSLEINLL
jgi:hypothetical protein